MSRDWTPKELINAEKWIFEEKGIKLRDISATFIDDTGQKIPINQDTYLKNKYPNSYFLLPSIKELYDDYEKNKDIFDETISVLEEKIQDLIDGKDIDEEFNNIKLWYEGKLDKNFSYSKYNNDLLLNYLSFKGRRLPPL